MHCLTRAERGSIETRRGVAAADERGKQNEMKLVDQPCSQQRTIEPAAGFGHDAARAQPGLQQRDGQREVYPVLSRDQIGDFLTS